MSKITAKSFAELNRLAHTLAFEHASSAIECACKEIAQPKGFIGGWLQLPVSLKQACIADEVRYLEARGLILRHPKRRRWISLYDESEATR